MKILLTGADGQLGWEMRRSLMGLGEIIAFTRHDLDLRDTQAIRTRIRDIKPNIIVNTAAYTAVDRAETEKNLAMQINAQAPAVINEEAERLKSLLIHYSTDYVFNGKKDSPYLETDTPDPINSYGESKLEGERAILQSDSQHIVLRTSWVYAARGNNFLLTVVRLLGEQRDIGMINDQLGAPTWARYIAQISTLIIRQLMSAKETSDKHVYGLYHLSNSGQASWLQFAELIRQALLQSAIYPDIKTYLSKPIRAISADQYPTAAARPLNSRLSLTKIEETFAIQSSDWKTAAQLCLDELISQIRAHT